MLSKNQRVALWCSIGLILIALSRLIHTTSSTVSTILLLCGAYLVGFGFTRYFSKPEEERK